MRIQIAASSSGVSYKRKFETIVLDTNLQNVYAIQHLRSIHSEFVSYLLFDRLPFYDRPDSRQQLTLSVGGPDRTPRESKTKVIKT